MLPYLHVIIGAVLALLVSFMLNVGFVYSLIIFLSFVLIDFDHYLIYLFRKKNFSLKKAYNYFLSLRNKKGKMKLFHPLCLFHTIEFLFIIFILSFFSKIVFFIFVGFLSHSIFDIIDLAIRKKLYVREFSLIRYIKNRKKPNYI